MAQALLLVFCSVVVYRVYDRFAIQSGALAFLLRATLLDCPLVAACLSPQKIQVLVPLRTLFQCFRDVSIINLSYGRRRCAIRQILVPLLRACARRMHRSSCFGERASR